ncbi:MAG: hypothetical protein NTW86_15595, partial [Candidatus Sumerlaeota bacterium]|nr:hypothetical protein [Candidatus Sumerlaeota bacterium]
MGASNALKTPRADTADRAYGRRERLEELRRIKSEHSRLKRQRGPRDNDDWGDIPYAGQFLFVPETDHPKGYVIGPRLCGRNFRRFLEQQPPYVSRFSSLLGGYYFTFLPYPMKWDPENYWTHLAPEHKKYNIIHGIHASQHFGIDLSIGLPLGFGGLLQKIERCRRENPNPDLEFYGALADVVIGIQNWIRAHVRQARLDAKSELSAQLRANLLELADLNDRLIESPPRTFREACQWTAWYQMAARMYNGSGALGRIDQYFYPYYIKDTAEGRLTDDEAIFHLACLNLCDPQYIHVGGIDAEGNDAANELSFLILEAVRRLR